MEQIRAVTSLLTNSLFGWYRSLFSWFSSLLVGAALLGGPVRFWVAQPFERCDQALLLY
jgi:hypothetical protein